MNCTEVQAWISLYVDDSLEEQHASQMFEHMGTCSDCQRFLRSTLKIRSAVNTDARIAAPISLDQRVMGRVEGTDEVANRRMDMLAIRVSIPVPAAMAMAVVLVIGSMVVSPLFFERSPQVQISESALDQLPSALRTQMKLTRIVFGE